VGKIDEDTRVVVEIARELNDANKRKAIEKWQREREKENDEYRARIREIADEYYPELTIDKTIVDKYRLWIEQGKTCLYTGEIINCKDLFDGSKYDLEHTIPASISFDNELKNLTIANGQYNKQVKGNKFPSQLPNYAEIRPRLQFMEEKVAALEAQLQEWKNKTKFASTKDIKDACIQRRHLIRFDLDYWRYKLQTFTLTEYKAGWRNSQLKDTQLVTKYALPYLKTVFRKVEVEKASIVSIFRKIYGISPRKERKDRDKHFHHAEDAAVLTMIPPAAIRDRILLEYNEAIDRDPNALVHKPVKDWRSFHPGHILSIGDEVLVNFLANQRALTPTYKYVRKRGRQQFVREKDVNGRWKYKLDESGEPIKLIAKGDSIRGQLHKESMFGIIERNGEKWLVERCEISSFTSISDCRNIVDDAVRAIVQKELEARLANGETFEKARFTPISFPNGKAVIRKVRCRVAAGRGYLSPEKALEISRRDSASRHSYKQFVYAQNEENILCLYYEDVIDGKREKGVRIIGLHDLAQMKIRRFQDIGLEKYYQKLDIGTRKAPKELSLAHIITVGMKVILFEKEMEELKGLPLPDIYKRTYRVYKFNETSLPYVYLQHHLEARRNEDLGTGDSYVDLTRYQPRLALNAGKLNCAMEGKHFSVDIDGTLHWKF
jgi:CRISPR-associated endonuclease Csn1